MRVNSDRIATRFGPSNKHELGEKILLLSPDGDRVNLGWLASIVNGKIVVRRELYTRSSRSKVLFLTSNETLLKFQTKHHARMAR